MRTINQIINEAGADHVSNKLDINQLIQKLKSAYAEEINAWYQYTVAAPFLVGNERTEIAETFNKAAKDELDDHAAWLIERINKLGGNFQGIDDLSLLNTVATHKYIKPAQSNAVAEALRKNIDAEKGAIETYVDLEEFTRDKDVVTNTKIKEILADEEEHLQWLEEYLEDIKK